MSILPIASCTKKLNLKVIENDVVKIEHYDISEIATMHEFVDITNKRWNRTERICEANSDSIDSLFITGDSIVLKTSPSALMYDLAALKFGYKIIVLE